MIGKKIKISVHEVYYVICFWYFINKNQKKENIVEILNLETVIPKIVNHGTNVEDEDRVKILLLGLYLSDKLKNKINFFGGKGLQKLSSLYYYSTLKTMDNFISNQFEKHNADYKIEILEICNHIRSEKISYTEKDIFYFFLRLKKERYNYFIDNKADLFI